jgi:hypothetical protein
MNFDEVINYLQQGNPDGLKIVKLLDLSSTPTPPLRKPITLGNIGQK